ncbi:hypothetical protein [Nocardia fluminea]|uniref:hypothetical protein n=1 Tax=Nocardia fluminea TaxID=134984 RepID=UPI003422B0A9
MTTFGPPDSKSDDDVLEGIAFWDAKAAQHDSDGEPDAAAQCREEAAKYRAEAIKRGIL